MIETAPHPGLNSRALRGQNFVKIRAMQLRIGRAVQPLVLLRQRKALDHLAGVVQPEHIGAGPHADRL